MAISRVSQRPLVRPASSADKGAGGGNRSDSKGSAAPAADKYTQGGANKVEHAGISGIVKQNEAAATKKAAAAVEAKAVDFSKLSQAQQYDYLRKMTVQRAGGDASAWRTGDREVNMVGIRSFGGKPHGQVADKHDDMIYVARMVDGQKRVEGFRASVDGGIQSDPNRPSYRLDDAFYKDGWKRGGVTGGEQGLRQVRSVDVWKDANNDGVLDKDELKAGRSQLAATAQLQFHRGGMSNVGDVSSGCQVIAADQYDRFQKILAEAPDTQKRFSYNLIDSSRLPGINPDGSIQDTAADLANCGHEQPVGESGGGIGKTPPPLYGVRWPRKGLWT